MAVADALETAAVGIDGGEALGHVGPLESGGDPLREIAPSTAEPVARLDEVEEERAQVDLGERVPELPQGAGLVAGGNGDEMRLEEAEGLRPRGRRLPRESAGDGR